MCGIIGVLSRPPTRPTPRAENLLGGLDAAELELAAGEELEGVACRCVVDLTETLRPEYAEILRENPSNTEAAFNYEYLVRLRAVIAARQPGSNEAAIGPDIALTAVPRYFNGRAASIYGGSNEIQRNIIAKMVLGL